MNRSLQEILATPLDRHLVADMLLNHWATGEIGDAEDWGVDDEAEATRFDEIKAALPIDDATEEAIHNMIATHLEELLAR
jgi:hypothetical protein